MGDAAFQAYGWRFPFLLSAVLVVLSGYIRLRLEELPLFARLKEQGKASANPALDSFSSGRNWGLILIALFGATAPEGVVWYTGQFYALTYMIAVLKMPFVTVYLMLIFALLFGAPFFLVFGWLSDRIGRKPIMRAGFALAVITYWPVFTWLGTFKDNPIILCILVFYMVILVTMVYGPIAAFLVELFPAQDPLHLDVVAVPRRQRRVRRRRAVHRHRAGDGVHRHPADRPAVSDGGRRNRRGGEHRHRPRADARHQDLGRGRRPHADPVRKARGRCPRTPARGQALGPPLVLL